VLRDTNFRRSVVGAYTNAESFQASMKLESKNITKIEFLVLNNDNNAFLVNKKYLF